MSNPSLILPQSPAYGEDYVYAAQVEDGAVPLYNVLPLTFTRASGGTRINKDGLVQNMPYNLVEQSETFDSATWQKSGINVTVNAVANPLNGQTTADNLVADTGNNFHYIFQALTYPTNVVTMYVYVKANGYNWFVIDTGITYSYYNISTGTLGTTGVGGTASIQSVGNGWYRCGLTFTGNPSSAGVYLSVRTANNGGSFTGDGVSGILTYGAQLNIGSTAQPYLATTDRLNMPRITYPVGGGCGALLLEKQSTNLTLYSEQFDNAGWIKYQGGTITANSVTSPDGTQNADTLNVASGQTFSGVYQSVSGSSDVYTISIFAKYNTKRWMFIFDASASAQGWFDLQNGVVGTITSGYTGTIQNFGNGWYRCTFKKNTAVTPAFFQIGLVDADGESTPSSNGSSYIWGAQFEASSYATSYIPTTSTSATRIADYLSKSGLGLTNTTFFVNFIPLDYVVELFDFEKTGGGRMFYIAVQSNGFITFNSVSGGTIGAVGSVIPKNQTCKLAFSLNASTSNVKVYINGSIIGTYATNITTFGAFFGLQSFGYNPGTKINEIKIYSSVLTDAECQTLTS